MIAEDDDGQSTLVGERLVARGVVLEVVAPVREAGDVDLRPGVEEGRKKMVDLLRAFVGLDRKEVMCQRR